MEFPGGENFRENFYRIFIARWLVILSSKFTIWVKFQYRKFVVFFLVCVHFTETPRLWIAVLRFILVNIYFLNRRLFGIRWWLPEYIIHSFYFIVFHTWFTLCFYNNSMLYLNKLNNWPGQSYNTQSVYFFLM